MSWFSSVRGLGKCVVDGTMTPETYRVSRDKGLEIMRRDLHSQKTMIRCSAGGSTEEIDVTDASTGQSVERF